MPTRDEFRSSLVAFSERAMKIRQHLKNEEATKVSLVQPFIALLGYDDRDPTEVAAEHAADFSEKYRNRVDYAILKEMLPVIAVECKSVGNGKKDDRGQLKAYFNACKTVKLGILTDGVIYEFFVDSNEPNLMDEEPFLTVDFAAVAAGRITDTMLDGLLSLIKTAFDPASIAENARMNLTYLAFHAYLTDQFSAPSVDFTRFLLRANDIKHVRAAAIENYREIAKTAFQDVFNARVLQRLDISSTSVQKAAPTRPVDIIDVAQVQLEQAPHTSTQEIKIFEDIRRRLAFLSAGDADLFAQISQVSYRDYQGKFVVYLEKERKGRLLDVIEGKDGSIRFQIMDGVSDNEKTNLAELDERLLSLFKKRVADAGLP
jgi:predicted type IV restriction endonuclease